MSEDFRSGLDALAHADPEALQIVVSQAEEHFFEATHLELGSSTDFVGTAPPRDLLRGHVLTATDVARAIERTEPRWRLDVIMALDDYLT